MKIDVSIIGKIICKTVVAAMTITKKDELRAVVEHDTFSGSVGS
jgi:hypothetical protein